MQLLRLNTLSIACFISLGLVSCGGGSGVLASSSSVTNSTFAFDENNNLYLSTNGTDYSLAETTGLPTETPYTTQAASDVAAMVGTAGVVSLSSDFKSWSSASSPATTKVNGLTLSAALYDVVALVEQKKSAKSTAVQASSFAAVGQSGNIQVVFPASSSLSLSQAVKQHKLKYRQVASVTNNDLFGVAQASDGNVVAVGTNNTGVISTDGGNTFTAFTLPAASTANTTLTTATTNYYDVEAIGPNQDLFVVGGDGMLQTSPTGETWTPQKTGTSNALLTIKYASGNYVAGGLNSTMIYSPDGKNWKPSSLPAGLGTVNIRDISVNPDNTETAYGVITSSNSNLSARDFFLRKSSLVAATAQTQIVLRSRDGGKTWVQQSVSSGTSSSTATQGVFTPFLTTIQNIFNNAKTKPDHVIAGAITAIATGGEFGFSLLTN